MHRVLQALAIAIVVVFTAATPSAAQAAVSLTDAVKNPAAFRGKKVCWIGRQMSYSSTIDAQGRKEAHTTWLALDDKKSVVPELAFVVDEADKTQTDDAVKLDKTSGDPGDRRLCGTISGAKAITINVGSERRSPSVPLLTRVAVDAPPPTR